MRRRKHTYLAFSVQEITNTLHSNRDWLIALQSWLTLAIPQNEELRMRNLWYTGLAFALGPIQLKM